MVTRVGDTFLLIAAFLPAAAVEEIAVRALAPWERSVSNLRVGKPLLHVVMLEGNTGIKCYRNENENKTN